MPKSKAEEREAGAFPQSVIVKRIEEEGAKAGFEEGKQLAGIFDAAPNWWTRRRTLKTDLKLAEVSVLAERIWPDQPWFVFLDAYHRRALARGLAELSKETIQNSQHSPAKTARAGGRRRRGGG